MVFFGRGAGDKQVVQVGIGEGEAAQHLVDKTLESLGRIAPSFRPGRIVAEL